MRSDTITIASDDDVLVTVHRWMPSNETPDPERNEGSRTAQSENAGAHVGNVRGIVQIAHGMAEHGERYARFARELVEHGWSVWADDHRGHGRTAKDEASLGHFADEDGWARVIADLRRIAAAARKEHPGVPLVLLGHSMGSFLAQSLVLRHPQEIDALILSGSSAGGGALVGLGKQIAKLERLRSGKRGKSALLTKLSFGQYNSGFEGRTEFDWLSRDPIEVDKYVADPKCGFRVTNQAWIDLLGALEELGHGDWSRLPREMPILVFSGERDPVGDRAKGVRRLLATLRGAGLAKVADKLYPEGRHEMLNEINRDEVFADVIRWLDANVRGRFQSASRG